MLITGKGGTEMSYKPKTVRDVAGAFPEMYNYNYKWRNTDNPELEKDIDVVLAESGYKFKGTLEETIDIPGSYNDLKGYLNCEIEPLKVVVSTPFTLYKDYEFNYIQVMHQKEGIEFEETSFGNGNIVGEAFLRFSFPDSDYIRTFILTGGRNNQYVYTLIYSDFEEDKY